MEVEYDLLNRGDKERSRLTFNQEEVDFEFKNFQLCTVDELAIDGNPFASFQDAFGWGPYEVR